MKQALHLILYMAVAAFLLMGCTGKAAQAPEESMQPADTTYTLQAAMAVYDYDPVRALQIIDSAVIMGNLSEVRGDFFRSRIYAWSVMGQTVDSLLHGPEGVRFDSARVVGERLLAHDSLKMNIGLHQDVLEVLVCVARQQQDTARWLRRSQELVEVCHRQGDDAEPEALRTEAEVGAVLCAMGQRERGMARLDSVIAILDSREHRQFNWLDATIIALKRKINVLSNEEKYVETLPLARRIIDRLDDYEQHPQDYHDGTYREPADSTARADYIHFYRTQMQSRLTAAYATLGEQGSVEDVYEQIERSVRDVTAREHIARYHALEQQMLRQEAESRSQMMAFVAVASVSGLLVILLFTAYLFFQKRRIQQKNRVLARMIESGQGTVSTPADEKPGAEANSVASDQRSSASLSTINYSLFTQMDSAIRSERLYANPTFQRQDACEHFNLRREVLNQLLTDFADGQSFPAYINSIRLSEACRLLSDQPAMTVNAIAEEVGLTPRNLRRLFVDQYGMTPSEFREQREQN
ncbi:MAG: AraC family transcriptional regulator [Bacteroidaceae bacterium]|nr:AraC family transcriptional regulator [Bacteroidaceae bacterium]MBR1448057.1 AraC family transcriptional regulator [Prevotella sp.]